MRAMNAVATATRTQNAQRILYNVTACTLVGLVTLYCMASTREHVPVCVVWSAPRDVFCVKIELRFLNFDIDVWSAPVGPVK